MSIKFSREFRRIYAEKVLEFANLGSAGLIFTQFLPGGSFSWATTIGGIAVYFAGLLVSYFVYHRR